ncbi:unnamed protein product [Aphanomyces euteiches]|nr:hypothetical protein AeRB84_004014 [Aphanomyces euteiches]
MEGVDDLGDILPSVGSDLLITSVESQGKEDAFMWATVCSILDTPRTNEQSTELPKAKRLRVYTNKSEVQQLEAEICELQAQLQEATRAVESRTHSSRWERIAEQQRMEKFKAMQENRQLRTAVQERGEYIERFQKLIVKTPRWTALPGVAFDDKSHVLPEDPRLRIENIHRLADEHYSRYQNEFVKAGALDLGEDMCKGEPIHLSDQQLGFRSVNHVNLPAPFRLMAWASWKGMSNRTPAAQSLQEHDIEILELIDDHTLYHRYQNKRGGVVYHSNMIRKYYEDEQCAVIVWVPVLQDGLVPLQPIDMIDELCCWWLFTAHPDDSEKSRMTVVSHWNISRLLQHQEVNVPSDQVLDALKKMFVSRKSLREVQPPSFLQPFIERSRRLRNPMRQGIEEAIRDYRHSMKSGVSS